MQLPPSPRPARTVRLAQSALARFGPSTLLAVACVVAGSGAVSHAATDRARFGAAWTGVDCKTFDVPAAIAAQSDCGYVTVPEQHAQPQGRTIQLGVIRIRSSGSAPAADPLVVEQGGPGDSTIGDIVNKALPNLPELPTLLKGRDLIFMEERGTRFAKPFLFCPEHHVHNIAVAKGEIPYTVAS